MANGTKFFSQKVIRQDFDPRNESIIITVHGQPGVGKTTFAANWGQCLGGQTAPIATLDSHQEIDGAEPLFPEKWTDFVECGKEILASDKKKFPVVSVDDVETMLSWLEQHVCKLNGVDNIRTAGGGWGAGHRQMSQILQDEFINPILADGRQIIAVTHTKATHYEDPINGDFYKFELGWGSSKPALVFENRSSAILYLALPYVERKEALVSTTNKGRDKITLKNSRIWIENWFKGQKKELLEGLDETNRILFMGASARYTAKVRSRRNLPPFIPLPGVDENTAQPFFDLFGAKKGSSAPTKKKEK